jgi:hypothetical protein
VAAELAATQEQLQAQVLIYLFIYLSIWSFFILFVYLFVMDEGERDDEMRVRFVDLTSHSRAHEPTKWGRPHQICHLTLSSTHHPPTHHQIPPTRSHQPPINHPSNPTRPLDRCAPTGGVVVAGVIGATAHALPR